MSFFGLSIAGSALDAAQVAANVTSDNISNVNTPGASRQEVDLQPASPIPASPAYDTHFGPGTIGDGVLVNAITRVHEDAYDALFREATSSQYFYQVQQQQLTATQASLGEPNAGISSAYSSFQTAIQSLAANPTDKPTRENVIQQAQALTAVLNSTAQSIQTQQAQVVQQAGSMVTQINGIIDQIAALDGQIRASSAVGDNPNTFADQRDYLIDRLSQYLSVQTSVQPNGSVLITVGGQALVNDTVAYHLAAPVIGRDASGNPVLKVGFADDPNPVDPTAIDAGGGQLGGALDLYNDKLTPYLNALNNFASALGNEFDRVTQSSYDLNGNPGTALFQPIVAGSVISAANIKVGISDPSQVPAAVATTAAGTLVSPANSADNTIDTSALLDGNVTLNNPPASPGGVQGFLMIAIDGITPSSVPPVQVFKYDTSPGGNADTIDDFINNFNAGHYGVDASWDASSQKIVFTADPMNTDLNFRAEQEAAGGSFTPSFTITDTNPTAALASGAAATSLLSALGAGAISGVPQTSQNAFGAANNGGANALLAVFNANVGVGALQTTAGNTTPVGPGTVVIQPPAGDPQAFAQVQVGQVLTIDAQPNPTNLQPPPPPQENVVVSAVDRNTGTITVTMTQAHAPGFSITTAQTQTLGQAYSSLVTQIGLDTQTATTGTTTQTSLANNIDQARQSIDGINIDEETQNLIKFQNAYQAAAQNMNVLEQMLQTLITMAQNI